MHDQHVAGWALQLQLLLLLGRQLPITMHKEKAGGNEARVSWNVMHGMRGRQWWLGGQRMVLARLTLHDNEWKGGKSVTRHKSRWRGLYTLNSLPACLLRAPLFPS